MDLLIILIVILIVLIIIAFLAKKSNMNITNSENFYPTISSSTPEGSSALYGWEQSTYDSTWAQRTRTKRCCACNDS